MTQLLSRTKVFFGLVTLFAATTMTIALHAEEAAPAAAIAPAPDAGFETEAQFAYMTDFNTGTVLLEKRADESMTPSSMTKMMTLYLLFDAMKRGDVTPDTKFPVSERAWRMGGSKMFVQVGSEVAVKDLIPGIIVQSGNDACMVVAEGLAGSEEAFADQMNAMAKKLGMEGSHFMNASGWPDPSHYSTVHDLATLARHIIKDFPEYYPHFKETEFTYNGIKQPNRNRLLYRGIGVDGLKTGHTEDGGYGITTSGVMEGRRVILVVNGLKNDKERIEEADRLLRHGFRDFKTVSLFHAGDVVENASVWMGKQETVPLVVGEDVEYVTTRRPGAEKEQEITLTYESPIPAPITQGAKLAELTISRGGSSRTVPLLAGANVDKLSFMGRMKEIPLYYIFGGGKK